ncbi:MAG: hypothetical protein AAGB32_04030, partial [Pseudomonadota bacterium]
KSFTINRRILMSVTYIIGGLAIAHAIRDAWQANVRSNDPYYSNASLIDLPMTLNGTDYTNTDSAVSALIETINGARTNFQFDEGKSVSTDGAIALHIREQNEKPTIRIGFRSDSVQRRFERELGDTLQGLRFYDDNAFFRVIGTLPARTY